MTNFKKNNQKIIAKLKEGQNPKIQGRFRNLNSFQSIRQIGVILIIFKIDFLFVFAENIYKIGNNNLIIELNKTNNNI